MLINRVRKIVFIHVQKTGGMSIRALLQQTTTCREFGDRHLGVRRAQRWLGDKFADYYSFAFVRNPWDRVLSRWKYRQKRGAVKRYQGFADFVHRHVSLEPRRNRTQTRMVCDDKGRLLVSEVYRFENFEDEARRLMARLGLPHVGIPHRNATQHDHYSTYYTDELRDVVTRDYADDIRIFGYAFERPL